MNAFRGVGSAADGHGTIGRTRLVGLVAGMALVMLLGVFAFGAGSAKAAFVANPGPFNAFFAGGYLKVTTLDPFEVGEGGDLGEVSLAGTMNEDGTYSVPASEVSFPDIEQTMEISGIGNLNLLIRIAANGPVTGLIDPVSGETTLNADLTINIRTTSGSAVSFGGNGQCYVGSPSNPIKVRGSSLTPGGVPYNPGTARGRVADNTFIVPKASGCGTVLLVVNVNDTINDQLGLNNQQPGDNIAELEIETDPAFISNADLELTTKPALATNQTTANFAFTSSISAGLAYECQLDGGDWTACDSMTATYSDLADGSHTFAARGLIGSTVLGSTSYTWTVDTVVPTINITGGPSGLTNSRNATFAVSKSEPLSSITCLLDGNPVTPCSATASFNNSFTNLADGAHSFTVSGQDAAGNAASITRNWTVDATKPVVAFTSTPPNPSSTAEVQFVFTANDNMTANPQAQCQVRNMRINLPNGQIVQPWTNCTSPNNQVRPTGKWRFELRATDNAGNVSDPVTYDWDANTAEPVIDRMDGPSGSFDANRGGTRSSDAEFDFKAETFDIDGEIIEGTTFRYECWLDDVSLGDCEPPMTLHDLTGGTPITEGHHIFEVQPFLVALPEVAGFRTAYEWYVDTIDPTVAFESTPNADHSSSIADFVLNTDGTGSNGTAMCKLDNQNWSECDSNTDHSITVADGHHTLQVKALDQASNESPVIVHEWVTDTVDPTASITSTPLDNDKSGQAAFQYVTNDDRGVQAICQLNDSTPELCGRTDHFYASVPDGVHTFKLIAVDPAGNQVERTHTWRADTTAPSLTIEAGPESPTALTNAAFKFAATDAGSGIESVDCRIDGGAWEPCTNGSIWNFYPGPFGNGQHKFETRIVDVAQNSTIKHRFWTVALAKPDVAIATTLGETTSKSVTIKFLSSSEDVTFECKLDIGSWQNCTSPVTYNDLNIGNHVFQVRSVTPEGMRSDEESIGWTVKAEDAEVCPDGQTGTPPNCVQETCPDGEIGTPPNCVKKPVDKCADGEIGTPPNCEKQLPSIKNPTADTGTFDGKNLAIRLKCPAGFKPKCIGNAVAVTGKGKKAKVMSSRVKSSSKAGKWKLVTLVIKPAFRNQVLNMTASGKRIVVKQSIRSKVRKKKDVFHTYKVRAKG